MTHWHITFGTYGTRLHGGELPTVDRDHNVPGTPVLGPDPSRESFESELLKYERIYLSDEQRRFVEGTVPTICERGGWTHIVSAAQPDHVHVLLGADPERHGKQIRRWLKRWLGEALSERWERAGPWWTEGGSTKATGDDEYFANVVKYITRQRASVG